MPDCGSRFVFSVPGSISSPIEYEFTAVDGGDTATDVDYYDLYHCLRFFRGSTPPNRANNCRFHGTRDRRAVGPVSPRTKHRFTGVKQ